jgi:hypothetical protein
MILAVLIFDCPFCCCSETSFVYDPTWARIHIDSHDLVSFFDCFFANLNSPLDGGAFYAQLPNVTIIHTSFVNCRSPKGGAFHADTVTLVITRSCGSRCFQKPGNADAAHFFSFADYSGSGSGRALGNETTGLYCGREGATNDQGTILVSPRELWVHGFNVTGCWTDGDGAALLTSAYQTEFHLTHFLVRNCTGNTILRPSGAENMEYCEFYDNHARTAVIGLYLGTASPLLLRTCIFARNTGSTFGLADASDVTLYNCVFLEPVEEKYLAHTDEYVRTQRTTATLKRIIFGTHFCPTDPETSFEDEDAPLSPTSEPSMSSILAVTDFFDASKPSVSAQLPPSSAVLFSAFFRGSVAVTGSKRMPETQTVTVTPAFFSSGQIPFSSVLPDSGQYALSNRHILTQTINETVRLSCSSGLQESSQVFASVLLVNSSSIAPSNQIETSGLIGPTNRLPDSGLLILSNPVVNSPMLPISSLLPESVALNATGQLQPTIAPFCSSSISASVSVFHSVRVAGSPFHPLSNDHRKSVDYRKSGEFAVSLNLNASDELIESALLVSFDFSDSPTSPFPSNTDTRSQTVHQTESADSDGDSDSALTNSDGFTRPNDEQRDQGPTPSGKPDQLGMILGIVFGLLAVIIAVVVVLYLQRQRAKGKVKEDSEPDEVTTFYNDNRAETQKEYEMAFENPVFDDNAATRSSDAFDDESAEALEL